MIARTAADACVHPFENDGERGSAILMAVFVLAIIATMGVGLCFLGMTETRMSQSSTRVKQAFYLAEAGIEDGRTTLHNANGSDSFDDELLNYSNDGTLDFDPQALVVVYDSDGVPTGFTVWAV